MSTEINETVDDFLERNVDKIASELNHPKWMDAASDAFQAELRRPFQEWCREQHEQMWMK